MLPDKHLGFLQVVGFLQSGTVHIQETSGCGPAPAPLSKLAPLGDPSSDRFVLSADAEDSTELEHNEAIWGPL